MGPVIKNIPGNSSSATTWHPPIGVDRRNEALDRLTLDFAPGHQTPNPPAGFPADRQAVSPSRVTPAQGPSRGPAAGPVAAPAAGPEVSDKKEAPDHKGSEHQRASDDILSHDDAPSRTAARSLDDIDQYLWHVYERSTTKRDASGDFTWKDEAAAARLGLVTKQYVIGGMDPDFRELLYNLGHALDTAGIKWTILSGFRDDYRQGLASGYKAHVGNSFHGGSRATGGYGHGCAADIEASDGDGGDNNAVWKFVDQHGEKFGIFRPMKGIDPAHVQPFGNWHDIALNLRKGTGENTFVPASIDNAEGAKVTPLVDTRSGVSEAQFDCIRSHHHDFRMAGFSHHHGFMHRTLVFHPGRMHRFGRRRMVVDRDRRASTETSRTTEKKYAKAEAVGENRRRNTQPIKEASASAERTHWEARHDAKGHDAKSSEAKGSEAKKRSEAKGPEANGSATRRDAKGPDVKAPETKRRTVADRGHADERRGRKSAASEARQAKARSHVAERGDAAADKNDKKL
ncbi:MAG: hypothetical protein J2P53_05505 [Bradyrhizobiaceae bacterium]|nr:hypothetical protein [Bradyrhizobiaceae bacterium]